MCLRLILIIWLFGFQTVNAQSFDSRISELANQVQLDSLLLNVRLLSGEQPITIGDSSYILTSRKADAPDQRALAATYLSNTLTRYGLQVVWQQFVNDGNNVYAIQKGTSFPDEYVVIGAHYDSQSSGFNAPGADDNASGTSAVLEAARVMSQLTTDYSIVYALFDQEEIGLIGSTYFAETAFLENWKIRSVINLDMIAYDQNNDGRFVINFDFNSAGIAAVVENVVEAYSISVTPVMLAYPSSRLGSDHISFWTYGFPAVLIIEHAGLDFNPYWHTSSDTIDRFNMSFFTNLSRLAVVATASLASGVRIPSVEELFGRQPLLADAVPNPFFQETAITYTLPYDSPFELVVYDVMGREVDGERSDLKRSGTYSFSLDGDTMPSGIYFYRLSTGQISQTKSVVHVR